MSGMAEALKLLVIISVAEVFATQRQLEGEVKQLHAGLSEHVLHAR